MRIANAHGTQGPTVIASRDGEGWVNLTHALESWDAREGGSAVPFYTIQALLEAGRFDPSLLVQSLEFSESKGAEQPVASPVFRIPLARPGQIIALARNYHAHAAESTLPIPHEPIFFAKSNTSVIGPNDKVVLPPNLGRIEPEIELAIVIGKRASHVPAMAAADHIAGYTILNDVSAQELQAREIREGYPLFRCKSLPTFTPIGPCIVTVDEAGVTPALRMTLRVNGETRVVTNTSGLTFGVPKLIEFISGYVTLLPGDIITTGCPKAAGAISPGDVLELEIEKIGTLRNPVVAGTEPCPV
jgi:2-keto-4-pentenoate hydratase/2-oxohepta-3-ene-1,7-dioic acid hydratase in catechol pathway